MEVSWLFETSALRISPAESPFWYTSGLIGPYYINTHFLCGGEKKALELLEFIDLNDSEYVDFPTMITAELENVYASFAIYRDVVDALCAAAREQFPLDKIHYVSGGQRRDWFFAPIVAQRLDKPCLYLYNDLSVYDDRGRALAHLDKRAVLNVADLLTVGSSYTKKWIPAIADRGGALKYSLNVVDRNEGAVDNLKESGVQQCESLFVLGPELFDAALAKQLISDAQYELALSYYRDPFGSMQAFLKSNPSFVEEAKASSDEKKRQRCQLMLKEDPYKLGMAL